MKIVIRLFLIAALLAAGFAAGFPAGKSAGFDMGSEWALVQAKIVAHEAGLYMPVSYDNGKFVIVMKQPHLLYRRAWRLADLHEKDMAYLDQSTGCQDEPIRLAGNTLPVK
jgi:hypothetical protein